MFPYVPAAITRVFELRSGRWRVADPIDIAMPPKQAATMGVPGVETIGGDEPLPKKELKYPSPRIYERRQPVTSGVGTVEAFRRVGITRKT